MKKWSAGKTTVNSGMECGHCVSNLRNAYWGIQKDERRRSPKHTEEAAVETKLASRWLRAEEDAPRARAGGRARDEGGRALREQQGTVHLPPKVTTKAGSPEKVDHLPNGELELVTKGEALLMLACGGGRGPLTRVHQRQRQALDMPPATCSLDTASQLVLRSSQLAEWLKKIRLFPSWN